MNRADRTFRDKLMDIEKPNPTYKKKYQKEVQAMLEKKLSYFWRVGFGILSVAGLLAFILFVELLCARFGISGLNLFFSIYAFSGVVLTLVWAIVTGWIAAKGKLNLRTQPACMTVISLIVAFLFLVYFVIMYVVPNVLVDPTSVPTVFGSQIAIMGFLLLVTIGICLILFVLYRAESGTREKLLEIEYRLVELAEKIESGPSE